MKTAQVFAAALFVAALLASPLKALAEENWSEDSSQEIVMFAPQDGMGYCYVGSAMDTTSGQIVDLYTLCAADDESTDSTD